jgi:subtilisin family serine protease
MSIRVAVVDSGVNPRHPHIGNIAGGVALTPGIAHNEFLDYIGHGTAVAAAIHEKAPSAQLYAVKVFDRTLVTRTERILQALEWCLDQGMQVVNLSLGTAVERHRPEFERIVRAAGEQGMLVVAAATHGSESALPGSLPGVIAVDEDPACSRDEFRVAQVDGQLRCFCAGQPRPIPGVPQSLNLNGVSFAVANMTGFVARALEEIPAADICSLLLLRQIRV